RNILMPLIAWVLANKYAKESLSDSGGKVKWALFWVFAYVIGQTIVAVDWVMSLEFPWISTLFGAYFFVEAFYIGLAFAAMFTAFRFHDFHETFGEKVFKKTQMDMMTMFFGFSIFWAYQFFSQFLVIWYGNIPEEVAYITKRQEVFGNPMLFSVIIILFLIPFWVLMSRKFKANPQVIRAIGLLVCLGIFLERFIMIGTYPHFSVNLGVALVEIAVMAALFVFVVRSDTKTLTAG
ncbi:MAG TPA: hypothetical protein PKV71_22130, partial [Calditrichia bacterium]|nr:hypothetical protein [Calditrichia bacterium]